MKVKDYLLIIIVFTAYDKKGSILNLFSNFYLNLKAFMYVIAV